MSAPIWFQLAVKWHPQTSNDCPFCDFDLPPHPSVTRSFDPAGKFGKPLLLEPLFGYPEPSSPAQSWPFDLICLRYFCQFRCRG